MTRIPSTIALSLLGVLALVAFAGAASAQSSAPASTMLAQAATPPPAAPAAPAETPSQSAPRVKGVEARITALHDELKITPQQEDQWKNLAQIMRDNAATMSGLMKARAERGKAMTALDDLRSYADITAAHADGLKKFIPAFESLYNSMSDDQKKTADTAFRRGGRRTAASTKAPSK